MVGNVLRPIGGMGAGKLGHKHIRVLDTEGIGAVAAYAHRAEIGIAEHDGICRTPTLFGEAIGADKIYLRFEGRFETVFPGQKSGENGKAVGVQLVIARKKDVGHAALVAEYRRLALADGERGTACDYVLFGVYFIHQGVMRIVRPFDHFEKRHFFPPNDRLLR